MARRLSPSTLRFFAKAIRASFAGFLLLAVGLTAGRFVIPERLWPREPVLAMLVIAIAAPMFIGYFGTLAFIVFRSGRRGKWEAFGEVFAWPHFRAARYLERVAAEREQGSR